MTATPTTTTTALPTNVNAQARRAWMALAHASTFEAASTAHPVRVGAAGWAARWAAQAVAKLADMAAAAKAEIADAKRAAQWAAILADEAAPVWGVTREYGTGGFTRMYSYEVRRVGEGGVSRKEALAQAQALRAGDPAYAADNAVWDAMTA